MKNGLEGSVAWWRESRERIKGMQYGDLSSIMVAADDGGEVIVEGGYKYIEGKEMSIGGEDIKSNVPVVNLPIRDSGVESAG